MEALSTRVTYKIIIFFVIIGGDELFLISNLNLKMWKIFLKQLYTFQFSCFERKLCGAIYIYTVVI